MNRFHSGARPVGLGAPEVARILHNERGVRKARLVRNGARLAALSGVLGLALMASSTVAQGQPGTEAVLSCLNEAGDSFADCVDKYPWYVAPLCAAKYAADAEFCMPKTIAKL